MSADDIDASKAPLIEHLIELRQRLIYTIIAILIAFVVCFIYSDQIYSILLGPYRSAVGTDEKIKLIFTAPQEFFFTQIKLALFGAIFLAFPIIATQVYMFVAPGLYNNERKAFIPYLLATPVLFIIGASLVYFVVMPLAMDFFLSMERNDPEFEIKLTAKVSEYLSLTMTFILAFGFCFQLPVLLTLMARAGLTTSEGLKTKRKYAVVGILAAAAVLTPPDPASQLGLAIPTYLLYEISIWCVRFVEQKRDRDEAADAAEP